MSTHPPDPGLGGERRAKLTGMEPSLGGSHQQETHFYFLLRKTSKFAYYTLTRMMAARGHDGALTSLRAALGSPNEVERAYAATAMGWVGDAALVPDLVAALTDKSRYVREVSVWSLIKIGDAGLADLRRALGHITPAVRAQIALVLGEIGSPEAITALLKAAEDRDKNVRRACNRGLFLIAEKRSAAAGEAVPALIDRLRSEGDAHVRAEIAGTLGAIGDRQAVTVLIEALTDPHAEVRAIAAAGLGRMSDVRAVEGLITLLGDDTPCGDEQRVCDSAAEALRGIATAEAIAALKAWPG
jgi:HEAT repeat protein